MTLSEKGQASTVDALLFVSLAAVLAGAIFVYTSDYGVSEGKELQNRFLRSYNSSVYKALLWSPVDRQGGIQDYLLAYAKERYSVTGSFDADLKKNFAENLYTLNVSVKDNYEYLFAVTNPQNTNQAELLVFKSDVGPTGAACTDKNCVYYCKSPGVKLKEFLDSNGNKFTSEGVITLPDSTSEGSSAFRTFTVMWPSRGSSVWQPEICGAAGQEPLTCAFNSADAEKATC